MGHLPHHSNYSENKPDTSRSLDRQYLILAAIFWLVLTAYCSYVFAILVFHNVPTLPELYNLVMARIYGN
jgi:hypothetical protein